MSRSNVRRTRERCPQVGVRLGELNRRDLLLQSGDLRLVRVELGLGLDDGRLRLIGTLWYIFRLGALLER